MNPRHLKKLLKKKETEGLSLFFIYAGISIFLLTILIMVYGLNQLRREKVEMYGLLQHQGQALVQSMEIAWENAILSESVVRQLVAARLLDNAYMLDRLITLSNDSPTFLKQVVRDTHILSVIVTDALGRIVLDSQSPLTSPTPPSQWINTDPTRIVNMLNPILSGQTNQMQNGIEPIGPFQEDLLWVAVARRSNPGAIIINVQADYIKRFRSEIGLSKIIKEIGSKPGIEYLVYEDPYNRIVAQKGESGPLPLKFRIHDYLKMKDMQPMQITKSAIGNEVLEIRQPFSFKGKKLGLIRIGLEMSKLKQTEKAMQTQALWFGSIIIILGIIGIFLIFFYQYRHYRQHKIREEELQRADKLISIGKLAAGVAHEIRNPLNAISMAIQRLQHEFLPVQEIDQRDFLQFTSVMRDEIKRVDRIIADFLSFAGQSKPVKEQTSLFKLTDDLIIFLGAEAERHNISIEKDYSDKEDIKVCCDSDQIKQSLMNIIRNAIQAMPDGGKVIIGIESKKDDAVITITDTGPGLDDEQIKKIFEFYYSSKDGGIGLGLPISQKIIEDHGGRIEVQSQIDQGTRFAIYLPITGNRCKEL